MDRFKDRNGKTEDSVGEFPARKQKEEREAHIKQVLLAIRNINQLIVHEPDPQQLLDQTCATLTETLGFGNTWIALLDDRGTAAKMTAASGFIDGFEEMRVGLECGKFPDCMREALKLHKTIVVINPKEACPDCPLSCKFIGYAGLAHRLASGENIYGVLTASVPEQFAHEEEEQGYFAEMANDLAFALSKIENEAARKRAEEALRESERKFRDTIKYLDEGYYCCALDGNVIEHNCAFNRILGFDSDKDNKGTRLPDFWQNPDDRKEYLNELMTRGYIRNFLINAKTIHGEKLVIMANSHIVKDEQGKPARIEGIFADFTERKQMEEELRKHHDELELLVIQRTHQLTESEQRMAKETTAIATIVSEMLGGVLADAETEKQVLNACLDATDSKYGMIGRINQHGNYDVITYNSRTLNDCAFPEALAWKLTTGMNIRGIWGWAMIHGAPILCNNLQDHPDRVGPPEGHVPIECFLAVPIREEEKVVGMIAVANKPGGYTNSEVTTLTRLVDVMAVSRRYRVLLSEAKTTSADLEQRVWERTAQLEAVNKELEAFSYSVSHDLRAPLRTIDGFTRILVDDCSPSLDTEGNRICTIIRENTEKMSRLIDDLLEFSHLGQIEMQLVSIDMSSMVNSVFVELTTPVSRKRIDFIIDSIPPAVGDPRLIRQAWMNLFSNALKFSSVRERAVIEVRGEHKENEIVYSIRDNGAGFDMQYIHKLFGVFQRLHSTKEFEGTGVGLAIVQRIIKRHDGRVWAEGATDKGATFYFTLQQKGA